MLVPSIQPKSCPWDMHAHSCISTCIPKGCVRVEMDRGHMHVVVRACVCLTGRMHVRISPPAVHACAHPSHRPTPITHEADESIFTAHACVCMLCMSVLMLIYIYIYIYICIYLYIYIYIYDVNTNESYMNILFMTTKLQTRVCAGMSL
jgi:hypothetical protein